MRKILYVVAVLALLVGCQGNKGSNAEVVTTDSVSTDTIVPDERGYIVAVGDMAPDFTVELLSGNKATLSQMQGNTVLLVFFESTCPDCKLQLSLLNGVLEQFADKNFALLTISRGEDKQTLTTLADNYGYRFDIGLDTDKSIYSLYATKYVPRCFVIDPLGHIIATSVGYSANDFAPLLDVIVNNLQN